MLQPDNEQIRKAQQGDGEAFGELVEMYQRQVFNLCYRMLGDAGEAEEAAQEAFIKAYRAMKSYDPSRAFSSWLLSIAAHYCIDQIRRRKVDLVAVEDLPYQDLPDLEPLPETSTAQKEMQRQVQKLLAKLDETDRAAVVMLYWFDYSYEEIAQNLNLTVSAVKSRLHRARRVLAENWDEQDRHGRVLERKPYESPAI